MPEVSTKMPKTKLIQVLETNKGLATDFLNFMEKKEKIYGETWIMDLGFMQMYIISNPDAIRHVLQTNQKNFIKSRSYDALKMAVGNGLVTSQGSFWRKQRRLSQPAFYKKNLENLFKDMGRSTQEYIDELEQKRGKVVDISKDMMHLTATIVLRALFNVEENESLDRVGVAIDRMQEYVMKYINTPYLIPFLRINGEHTRFVKERDEMDALIYKMVNDRKNSGEKKEDLLQMLMDVEDADTGEKMTEKQLRDELVTLFAAGHETSSNVMTFALMLLAKHPEVVEKLRNEVNRVLPNKEFPIFSQLRELTYTQQVINETMRLYPPAWGLGRQAVGDDVVNGYQLKKDKPVFLSVWNLHRSEKYWDQPLAFNPGRFDPESVKKRPNHHFLPFGAGPRMCIGNHFAMMEMQLILAAIIQRFDFKIADGFEVELSPLITLRPKNGMLLEVS